MSSKPSDWALMVAAQAWQEPETSEREMDVTMTTAMAKSLDRNLKDALSDQALRGAHATYAYNTGGAQSVDDARVFAQAVRQHFASYKL